MRIKIEVENEKQFDREISRFSNGISDFRIVAPTILTTLRQITTEQFNAEGQGATGAWRKLSGAYAKQKAKKYPGKTILRASDRMRNSLLSRTADSIVSINKNEMIYGTKVFYSSFHQDGTKKMPKRKIIDLNEAGKQRIVKAVQARLVRLAKEGK